MQVSASMISCGIAQLSGLPSDPEGMEELIHEIIKFYFGGYEINFDQFMEDKYPDATKAGVFSDVVEYGRGQYITNFVEKYHLGEVIETKSWRNTSGNTIKLWLWIFDMEALWEYWKTKRIKKDTNVGVANTGGSYF